MFLLLKKIKYFLKYIENKDGWDPKAPTTQEKICRLLDFTVFKINLNTHPLESGSQGKDLNS